MSYNITPILSTGPLNSNVGFNNSWVAIENDFNRPLFAQLTYDTNLDILIKYIDEVENLFFISNTILRSLTSNLIKIDSNTDHLEGLIASSNSFLNLIYAFEDIINTSIVDFKTNLIDRQNQSITLLTKLTSSNTNLEINTANIEPLIKSLSALQLDKQNQLISLGNSLTALQLDKQDQLITLLHQLTANTDTLEINTDTLEPLIGSLTALQLDKQDQLISLGNSLTASNIRIPGFSIPTYDEIDIQYFDNTNNIQRVSYFNNSTNIFSLSFTYIPNPPINDNAFLKNVKKI